ncbi:MAG: DUF4352 domain-containing protein [Asticcacaulis sp.]|uniref:DUF4352 domain-containing protein n=1 Tax=Asticcacaulis sp. TaxID=1872648 RepID=UPI003F7BCD8A
MVKSHAICFTALLFLTACGSSSSNSSDNDATAAAPTAQSQIGDTFKDDDMEIAVTDVFTRKKVGIEYGYENAGDGAVLVVVKTRIKNIGDKPISAFSLPEAKLVDGNGTEYSSDGGKTVAYQMEDTSQNAKLASDLNPDVAQTDAKVFEVSATRFDPQTWSVEIDGKKVSLSHMASK